MQIYQAYFTPAARRRQPMRIGAIEFAAEDDHDAEEFIVGHLNARFPKAKIASVDLIIQTV